LGIDISFLSVGDGIVTLISSDGVVNVTCLHLKASFKSWDDHGSLGGELADW